MDILLFLARLQEQLTARGLTALGITTDASPLYPLSIPLALGDIPHQVCEFPILKELTQVMLRVLAQIRKRLTEQKPKRPRGRPKNTAEDQSLPAASGTPLPTTASLASHHGRGLSFVRPSSKRSAFS